MEIFNISKSVRVTECDWNSGKMQCPIFAAMILQCEKPLHQQSNSLKSSFVKSWNRVTVKIWNQYLQYWQRYLDIFICHFAAAVPLLETDNISLVCQYIIQIWPVFMACTWKKSRSATASILNQHFGFLEKKYQEMEFWPLENESSPFCRTEWFYMHVKMYMKQFHLDQ